MEMSLLFIFQQYIEFNTMKLIFIRQAFKFFCKIHIVMSLDKRKLQCFNSSAMTAHEKSMLALIVSDMAVRVLSKQSMFNAR